MCSIAWLPLSFVTYRLEQWQVVDTSVIFKWRAKIRSLWRHSFAYSSCTAKWTKRHFQQLIWTKHKPCGTRGLIAQICKFMPLIYTIHAIAMLWLRRKRNCSLDFHGPDGCDAMFSETLCIIIFSKNIQNLRASCYKGNNAQAPDEWLRHNFSFARVLN